MADFLVYWPPSSLSPVMGNLGKPENHWAGDKLKRVGVGDTIWVVTHEEWRLILLFPLVVGLRFHNEDKRMATNEAAKHLGEKNLWESKCHVIAQAGTGQIVRRLRIADLAGVLRFVSRRGGDRLDVRGEQITLKAAQQMQNIRELTDASANMLREVWRKAAGSAAESIFAADIPSPSAKTRSHGAGFGNAADNEEAEFAAMNVARAWYEKRGWKVDDVSGQGGLGYDLRCVRGKREEHVEVKGIRGDREDFHMTLSEKERSEADDNFVVFVVTNALSPNQRWSRHNRADFARKFRLNPDRFRVTRLADS